MDELTTINVAMRPNGLVYDPSDRRTRGKVAKSYLSPSTLNKIVDGCPASWAGGKLGPYVEDPMAPNGTGTVIHAVMEDLFSMPRSKRTRKAARGLWKEHQASARAQAAKDHGLVWSDEEWEAHYAHYDASIDRVFDAAYMGGANRVASKIETIGTEIEITSAPEGEYGWKHPVEVWGVPVYGKVDRLDKDEDDPEQTFMRDYKIRGLDPAGSRHGKESVAAYRSMGLAVPSFPDGLLVRTMPSKGDLEKYGDEYGTQQRIYAGALEAMGYPRMAHAELLYLASGERRAIDLSEQAMEATRGVLVQGWEAYGRMKEEATFPYKPGILCRYCPLNEVCPAAQSSRFNTPHPDRRGDPLMVAETAVGSSAVSSLGPIGSVGNVVDPQAPGAGPSGHHVGGQDPAPDYDQEAHMNVDRNATPNRWTVAEKPYVSTAPDGYNIGSYGAGTYIGLVELAWEHMVDQGVPDPVLGRNVTPLSRTFAACVNQSAFQVLGRPFDFDCDALQRFSGALRSYLGKRPVPLAGGPQAVEEWASGAVAYMVAVTSVGLDLVVNMPSTNDRPWARISA